MRIKNFLKKVIGIGPPNDIATTHQKISWSQSGEDIIIEYLFRLRNILKPSCLDIGAYHPTALNNTYKFFLKGSKIVNIDANPAAIQRFASVRSRDVNLNVGVGAEKGEFNFYIMEEDSLNTFSEEEKISLEKMGHKLKEQKIITVLPLNEILKTYFENKAPDLVSIDAEGVDFEIVKSLDYKQYSPKVICVETINYTPDGTGSKRTDLCNFIEEAGYFEYANTNINSIFVNKAWWFAGK